MSNGFTIKRGAAAIALLVFVAGCSSDPDAPEPGAGSGAGAGAVDTPGGVGGISDITSVEYFNVVVGDRVFFETDRFDLDTQAQATLTRQAEWLAQNTGAQVVVEGHADERGTREYNLALGARRANAVRSFLLARGVPAGRMRTVSYGKERPVAIGSDAASWAQNRRAVSVVTKGAGS